jgi:hypothetical protein
LPYRWGYGLVGIYAQPVLESFIRRNRIYRSQVDTQHRGNGSHTAVCIPSEERIFQRKIENRERLTADTETTRLGENAVWATTRSFGD